MGESISKIPALEAGAVIGGKYRIERVLGEGGMGVVYEAEHVRIGQRVAIKVLGGSVRKQPELRARFEREARAAGQLRSPNIVRVVDVDATPEGVPFMVMELLEGRDLADELRARGPLPVEEAAQYALQTAAAMAEAHAHGIVHRDLKPSNLFLAREGAAVVLKVLDFGISKMEAAEVDVNITSTLVTMGTPLYMSPEQVRSAKNVDLRADVWSLGVILFELLAGRPPFTGTATAVSAAIVADPAPRLRDLRPEVPERLEAVIEKALTKSPEFRWPDMPSFAAALVPFGGERGVSLIPPAPTTAPSLPRPAQPSSPSFVNAPTLAAGQMLDTSPRALRRSPRATTQGAATPAAPTTEGSWTGMQPRPARGRRVLIAGIAAAVAAVLAAALGMSRHGPGAAATGPATPTAAAAATASAIATASATATETATETATATEPATPTPNASATPTPIPTAHKTGAAHPARKPTAPARPAAPNPAPAATSNPVRL